MGEVEKTENEITLVYHRNHSVLTCYCGELIEGRHQCHLAGERVNTIKVLECDYDSERQTKITSKCVTCIQEEKEKRWTVSHDGEVLQTFDTEERASTHVYEIATTESQEADYEDQAGYCKVATLEDIRKHDYVLTPGRYVGAADIEDDGTPFETKMTEMSQKLYGQMEESAKLDKVIRNNLEGLGYGK